MPNLCSVSNREQSHPLAGSAREKKFYAELGQEAALAQQPAPSQATASAWGATELPQFLEFNSAYITFKFSFSYHR